MNVNKIMKKIIIIYIILLIINNNCKSQVSWEECYDIQIQIEEGPYWAFRLFQEGLICKSTFINDNYTFKEYIDFFPLDSLNINVYKLKLFIANNSFFYKDTIIDQPGIIISGSPPVKISIINNDNLIIIYWKDGKCEELQTFFDYINEIIPDSKKNLYHFKYNDKIIDIKQKENE
jgi:hypothetical protein